MERKLAVGIVLVNKVLRVINERLGTDYEAHDVDVPLLYLSCAYLEHTPAIKRADEEV